MPTQWSEAEQVPLGCIAPPLLHRVPGGQSRTPLPYFFLTVPTAASSR